ncbi:alpha/beta fold hydrolase [Paenibacillus ehimensis]|uniref:Alpha/beta hydrolase n=1 Tax=Paenibacillus ehimensis TaxID=79264 RepID=A0ABT8VBE1_9BACL|nr:alpha/beta hydrolase [Paenibacillus ehimensis]MDO3678311.1 alpha/beta hydrolase [Paenibacillus ehimensis]
MNKIVKVNDVDVAYVVEGNGPGLLLIHGTGGTNENWGDMIKALSGEFTIVAPTYTATSEMMAHGEGLQLDDLVEQTVQAARQEGIESFHVVGYSLGAEIAAAVAAKYPERVISATMVAGWVESDLASAFQFDLWHKLYRLDRVLFAQFLIHTGFGPDFYNHFTHKDELLQLAGQFSEMLAPATGLQSELDGRVNIRSLISGIKAPSLVIGLTYDRMVPVEYAKELASLIPGAKYREIASGHLVPWEKGDQLIGEVAGFLRSIS